MRRLLSSIVVAALVACGGSKPKSDTVPAPAPKPNATDVAPIAKPASLKVDPDAAPLPLWSDVKKGTLSNGLTYYILKHGKPEKRALMWLAVNAGSVDEDDDQQGLAHFDEHMAFNGTKRFPKAQDVVDYLQSIGMRFGADLNAYTTWQQTVYQLEVPTDKPDFIAKGFQILRDWAGDVSYDDTEVKKESGVVLEEWRLGRGAGMRLFDKHSKVVFKGTRYADRITIGKPEILKKADRGALYRFYKDWYRPDNMAVIVVGEIDPAAIEKQIKDNFGDLKNPANERKRVAGGVPKADGTRVSVETDKELPSASIDISNLVPHRAKSSERDLHRIVVEQVYQTIMSERFDQLRRRAEAPFTRAWASIGTEVREIDAFSRGASVKNGKVEDALRSVFTEVLRVERHGFTQAELDRARTIVARSADETADKQATTDGRAFTGEIVRNFLENEFMIGAVAERDLMKKYLPTVTVDDLNALVKGFGGAENRVVTVSLPEGQTPITEARIKEIIGEVEKSQIPAWEEKPIPTTLMAKPPTPGKITKEKTIDKIGVTEWTLSNGARVVVKPTDFERDTVMLMADSPGGTALAKDKDYKDARFATTVAEIGGAGEFDADTLNKILAGKQVSVRPGIGETSEGINATASPKDLETMFQLLYLRVTAPRKDEEQFKVWQANSAEQMTNQMRSPEFQYLRNSSEALYNNNPRRSFPKPEDYAKVELDKALAFYKDRFGDVSDFTFVIVGEVDLAKLRPLVETYLASLPGKGRKDKEKDLGIRKLGGIVKKEWQLGIEPKASVRIDFHADEPWYKDKERDIYILGQVLSNALREELREEKGGVYGVGASGSIVRAPHQERTFTVQFGCDPTRVDELVKAMNEKIDLIGKNGPGDGKIDTIKEVYLRTRETELRQNRFWLSRLTGAYHFGDDPTEIPDTSKMIARMTVDNIKASVKHYIDRKQIYTAVRIPAPAK